jgi:site-specific DNA-methyltransferase (adenine-specific)
MINKIYNESCIETLAKIETGSLNMIFADPPFNVGKKYGSGSDKRSDYYKWCEGWIGECFRVLKDNGTFYLMTIDRHLEKLFPMMGSRGVFISLVKWRNVAACQDKKDFGLRLSRFWFMARQKIINFIPTRRPEK